MTPRDTTRRPPGPEIIVPVPPRPDTIVTDSSARADSARLARVAADSAARAADTLRAPLARAEMPPTLDIATSYRWNREALFSSGALTLLDLLERLPGVTGLRTGWLPSPQQASYFGDLARVRLYYDGIELAALNARTGGIIDLADIELWSLEELMIEHGATELRVYMRSWRVDRTMPYTRVDVHTGDQGTDAFRGFYGKRFRHGEALQLGGDRYTSTPERRSPITQLPVGSGGDALSLLARLGWARRGWSADAFVLRTRRTRDLQESQSSITFQPVRFPIPALDGAHTTAYLRAGYGDPDRGAWAQVLASTQRFAESSPAQPTQNLPIDEADTSRSLAEYVAAAGVSWRGMRLSATNRLRVFEGRTVIVPSARAGFAWRLLGLELFGQMDGADSSARGEAIGRLTLVPWLSFNGAIGVTRDAGHDWRGARVSARGEGALRVLGRLYGGGGALATDADTAIMRRPAVFAGDTADLAFLTYPQAIGIYGFLRGRVWRDVFVDGYAMQWTDQALYYRPRYQARGRLYLSTSWRRRFPRGDFHLQAGAEYEYRSELAFPFSHPILGAVPLIAPPSHQVSTLLEIRILQAVVTWQQRNPLGLPYEVVPGFEMPRQTNYYGVRWDFWN